MFEKLKEINTRPRAFEFYTAEDLWTNPHTSQKMLEYHLNETADAASRNHEFIKRSVEWICDRFDISTKTEIADFGCGPGLYANQLAAAGASVTGIDISSNSLQYAANVAKQKGLNVEYVKTNYLHFESDQHFDLIIMIMCDFCVLSPEQRKQLLFKFKSLLKPGGSVLLDVYTLNRFDKIEESATYERNQLNGFWSSNEYYCFVNTFKYPDEKVVLDKYTIVNPADQRSVYNWLQHFSENSLKDEFSAAGFRIEETYSDVAGSPLNSDNEEIAVVAKSS
jgi:2-polyprenyl-3-methyl-5-hydroxy-6-metoxy-1,4-benzoquinol methylase